MVVGIIYITGVILSFVLLLLLSHYYIKYEHHENVNIGQSTILCLFSWIMVIVLIVMYRSKYKVLIKRNK